MYKPMPGFVTKCVRLNTGEVLMGFVQTLKNGDVHIVEPQILITIAEGGKMEVNFANARYTALLKEFDTQSLVKMI